MPFRETLRIYNRERAAKRERSFRRCLVVLIAFFFLCLILLLANIPWKKYEGKGKEHHNASIHMPQVIIVSLYKICIENIIAKCFFI